MPKARHPDISLCDVIISYPQMTSACELLYRVIEGMGMKEMLDKKIASCIYTGMMTDTGNFSFNSNYPELYLIVAELVRLGVDKDRIYKLTLGTSSEARLRLNSYAIAEKMRLFPSHKAALTIFEYTESCIKYGLCCNQFSGGSTHYAAFFFLCIGICIE